MHYYRRIENLKGIHFHDTINVSTRGLHLQVWLLTSKVNSLTFHDGTNTYTHILAHNGIT